MGSASTACHTTAFCSSTECPFCAYRANPKVNCSRHTFLGIPTILSQAFSPLLQGAEFSSGTSLTTQSHTAPYTASSPVTAGRAAGWVTSLDQPGWHKSQAEPPRAHQHLRQPQVIHLACLLRAPQRIHARSLSTSEHQQAPGNFWNSAETPTHPAGQDTEGSLMDVHDGIVLPFVAIHLLWQGTGTVKRETEQLLPLLLSPKMKFPCC